MVSLWWTTPIHAIAATASGINCGASGLQSPLTFPILQLPNVPALYSGRQTRHLLHLSDKFFPKLNAVSTLSNFALALVCYLKRNEHVGAGVKWPVLLAAGMANLGTTVYTFTVMVPMNNAMRRTSEALEGQEGKESGEKEREFREEQEKWRKWNYGRAAIMLLATVLDIYAVFLDGRHNQYP